MEDIKEKTALLDKIIFGNIEILGLENPDSLIRREIIEQSNSKVNYTMADGDSFTRLTIKDDGVIDSLFAGSKLIGGKKVDYCNLETTIKDEKTGNLQCYTVGDYFDHLCVIQHHLETEYGIFTDFSDISIKEIEVNRTFKLNGNFEDYHRVINLIMTNLPTYLKNQMDWKKVEKGASEYQTYYATSQRSNKSKRFLLFKIYNKTKSVEKIVLLTDSYMRVEIRLVGTEKIKKALGTNRFAELTDQLINEYFDEQIQKMIVKPFEKWRIERDKYLLKLMKEQRELDIRHWQSNVLRILQNEEIAGKRPVLLDIEELIPLVNKLDLKANRRCDVKRNFRRQSKKFETVFCNHDDAKMIEIIEKLTIKDTAKHTVKTECNTVTIPNIGGMPKTA